MLKMLLMPANHSQVILPALYFLLVALRLLADRVHQHPLCALASLHLAGEARTVSQHHQDETPGFLSPRTTCWIKSALYREQAGFPIGLPLSPDAATPAVPGPLFQAPGLS